MLRDALLRQAAVAQRGLQGQALDRTLLRGAHWRDWLRWEALPLSGRDGTLVVAVTSPETIAPLRQALGGTWPMVEAMLVPRDMLRKALSQAFATEMAGYAATRVDGQFSCRRWTIRRRLACVLLPLMLVTLCLMSPPHGFALLALVAALSLGCFSGLRVAALLVQTRDAEFEGVEAETLSRPPLPTALPRVTMLVPLFRETEIAARLIRRLSRLTYPKTLLEVVLVLEEEDHMTHDALMSAHLPAWMRITTVPGHGRLRTKPRAMNYALDSCDGEIIGIWDAEDAPAPDQIERVVARFAALPDDVVCLQGILDFYNAYDSWLARCFTLEYASWFRIVLPGLERLGLVMPLGGTTLFLRRHALEELGGWDAHNVTEDADLGVRIARFGYQTRMVWTTTREEANCRGWPWVKQRSRWLKGFMVTYIVHMRRPVALWRDLGPRRFLGLQAFFIGTCGQFLLSPVIWTFWLLFLWDMHPAQGVLPNWLLLGSSALFLAAEMINMTIGWLAVARPGQRGLRTTLPTLGFYYLFGALAAYKALYELIRIPFFWDKTQHGHDPSPRYARRRARKRR